MKVGNSNQVSRSRRDRAHSTTGNVNGIEDRAAGLSVPVVRDPWTRSSGLCRGQNSGTVRARQHVAPVVERLLPFCLIAERHAGDLEKIGLFLDSPGVGQDYA